MTRAITADLHRDFRSVVAPWIASHVVFHVRSNPGARERGTLDTRELLFLSTSVQSRRLFPASRKYTRRRMIRRKLNLSVAELFAEFDEIPPYQNINYPPGAFRFSKHTR